MTLYTPAGSTVFNPPSGGDGFYCTQDTTGLDQAAVRSTVDDRGQTAGFIVHDGLEAGLRPTIVAQYKICTGSIADRDAAIAALVAQLRSIVAADGLLTRDTLDGERTLTVRCEINLQSSGGPQLKQVIFGLVSEQPAFT
jgi:hypothetical protein